MNFLLFCVFTVLGAGIWVAVLALVGYWFGRNEALVMSHIHWISAILAISCVALALGYIGVYRRRSRDREGKSKDRSQK
jgi:membrane protein DedA with SNARE-associated domain